MTKTSIFGEAERKESKNPIEFVKAFAGSVVEDSELEPDCWDNVVLISINYDNEGLDLIWAYHYSPNKGCMYLGRWNDGIV